MSATIETKIDDLSEAVEEIRTALLGRTAPGSAPGLIRRIEEGERERGELKRQVAELAASVRMLEATPGKTAITWGDRIGLGLLGLCLSAIGAILSRSMQGGPP